MKSTSSLPRRSFLQTSLAVGTAGAVGLLTGSQNSVQAAESKAEPVIKPGSTVLFQGDSITDAGRKKDKENQDTPNMQPGFGSGYAWMTAAALLTGPKGDTLTTYNRGISGNKVFQLADRWQADCLDLKPDVLSILIGVNDIWHYLNGKYDGTVEKYETDYRALLARTKEALPKVKFVICEPFVLKTGAVDEKWFPMFDGFREASARLAQENNAIFVPFQSMFDEAVKYAPPSHWAGDGVHPSAHGASLMASAWLRAVQAG
ncbi:SGNH/GDSL hydrolase family protein [uncultured Rubinisphaera sp.]|uniref:SGNH/GDSL hydrolase family protein n=1 Tax=uncultured Rubinisphaera sp. TaxID=1678686 RepID=UPI0030DC1675